MSNKQGEAYALPAILQAVARGALDARAQGAVPIVAAFLAIEAHRRRVAGESEWSYVPMPAGRDALLALSRVGLVDEDISAAIAWLAEFKVAGWPCVAGWIDELQQVPGGGRPSRAYLVCVGRPLTPLGDIDAG